MKAQSKKLTLREKELLSEIVRDVITDNETVIMSEHCQMPKLLERWNDELKTIIEKLS